MTRPKINTTRTLALAAAVVFPAALALAHGGATGIVKERMDLMDAIGKAHKKLTAMFKGVEAYDPRSVRMQAELIGRHAGEAMTRLFPNGSMTGPTEARPEIWRNWDEFTALAARLERFSQGLAAAADNGGVAGSPAAGMMGQGSMMGQGTMMGQGAMMGQGMSGGGEGPSLEMLAGMPAAAVYTMMTQVCADCHTRFRAKKN